MSRLAIGVDIGGSSTKMALVDEAGAAHARATVPTPREGAAGDIVARLVEAILAFRQRAQTGIEGIGFCVPQFSDGPGWVQRQAQNMPALEGYPLYPSLRAAFGPAIAMAYDVNAAGLAEYRFGRGRGAERMLFMAIGTGISTSLVTREQGLVGYSWGTMGDTGQIIVNPGGDQECTCGGHGCLEALAAAPALRRLALAEVGRGSPTLLARIKADKGDLEASDVSAAAEAGDAVALDILDRAGRYLGVALTSFLHIYRPSLIVLGGGVAAAGELLLEPIRRTMERLASPWYLERLEGIVTSSLGRDAAAIGCAALILYPDDAAPRPLRPSP